MALKDSQECSCLLYPCYTNPFLSQILHHNVSFISRPYDIGQTIVNFFQFQEIDKRPSFASLITGLTALAPDRGLWSQMSPKAIQGNTTL